MIKSPVFIRVVEQDRNRGFELLIGFDAKLVKQTAQERVTLTLSTRENLDAVIAQKAAHHNASAVNDVTAPGVKTKLRKLFNEPAPSKEA